MELPYSPIKSSTYTLYFPCLYPKTPSYFQAIKPDAFLTCDEMHKTLKARKMTDITFEKAQEAFEVKNLIIPGWVSAVTLLCFSIAGSLLLQIIPEGPLKICERGEYLLNLDTRNTEWVKLRYPCILPDYVKHNIFSIGTFDFSEIPLSLCVITAAAIALTFCAHRFAVPLYRQKRHNAKVLRFNANLDFYMTRLSYVCNHEAEVPPKDIGFIFPYLKDEQLLLLNFSQLKQAKHYWEQIFTVKLDASLFSEKQLLVWRSFKQLQKAFHESPQRVSLLLNVKHYKKIIGSEPKYFQHLVRTLNPLDDEKIGIFTNILEKHVLTPSTASKLKKQFKQIVKDVACGKKLTDAIFKSLKPLETSLQIETPFLHPVVAVARVLKRGKIKLQSNVEAFEYLKSTKSFEPVRNVFENYLIAHFSSFVQEKDLESILDEIEEDGLYVFKSKIDRYLGLMWNLSKEFVSIEIFEEKYLLSVKQDLYRFKKALFEWLKVNISSMQMLKPKKLLDIAHLCERLFDPNMTSECLLILQNKIKTYLNKYPSKMEKIYLKAVDLQNEWLINSIRAVFQANPDLFIDGFKTLPKDFLEIEILIT